MIKLIETIPYKDNKVLVYQLENKIGMKLNISTLGARFINLWVSDYQNNLIDVLVGYKKASDYFEKSNFYGGATIGRFANRIGNAKFSLNGACYHLDQNDHHNMLHGGFEGFDKKIFDAKIVGNSLAMQYLSKDMESGFPGNLDLTVTFTLTDNGEVEIDYLAKTDKDTLCNLTNHAYFNLGYKDDILDEVLQINSSHITEVDEFLIPNGNLLNIDNTPYSFLNPTKIGRNIHSKESLISLCNGFDFNYCINRKTIHDLELIATAYDNDSRIIMDVYSTLPGVQLYTSNNLKLSGKKEYNDYAGFCLETGGYPDSINHPNFPQPILKANDIYHEKTIYKFSIKEGEKL